MTFAVSHDSPWHAAVFPADGVNAEVAMVNDRAARQRRLQIGWRVVRQPERAMGSLPALCVVLPFFGRYEVVEEGIYQCLKAMEPVRREFEFTFVFDGPFWGTLPLVQELASRFPAATQVELDRATDLPAALFNVGLRNCRTEAVCFALAGQPWSAVDCRRLAGALGGNKSGHHKLHPLAGVSKPQQGESTLQLPQVAARREWLIANERWFDESPLLQSVCDRLWLDRIQNGASIQQAGDAEEEAALEPLARYPYHRHFRASDELVRRYVACPKQITQFTAPGGAACWCEPSFLSELPEEDAGYLQRRAAAFGFADDSFQPSTR